MDGNGRWAEARGRDRSYGHLNGVESVRASVKAAIRNGVEYLTLYAFSTENWSRPREEVDMLMELFCRSVTHESRELQEQGVRVRAIGRREKMSPDVQAHLSRIEEDTSGGDKLALILALNYSAREEIACAAQELAAAAARGELAPDAIDSGMLGARLWTASYPDPDLLIRTSGERRLSNFLLWQSAYTELYFTDTLWPDFREGDFDRALEDYGLRERRYGGVSATHEQNRNR